MRRSEGYCQYFGKSIAPTDFVDSFFSLLRLLIDNIVNRSSPPKIPCARCRMSADDDALPRSLFNEQTGAFDDTVDARIRSKLSINFGNPHRGGLGGDAVVPKQFTGQRPVRKGVGRDEEHMGENERMGEGVGEAAIFEIFKKGRTRGGSGGKKRGRETV